MIEKSSALEKCAQTENSRQDDILSLYNGKQTFLFQAAYI